MRNVTVAATQFACSWDLPANADTAEALIRQAAGQGGEAGREARRQEGGHRGGRDRQAG